MVRPNRRPARCPGTQSPGIDTSLQIRRPVEMTVALLLVCVTGAITALMALVVVVRAPR